MPYFDNSMESTISGSQMNDVAGDQTIHDNSTHNTRSNSDNTFTSTVKDSYNDHSRHHVIQGNIYNNNTGAGTFNNIQGNQHNSAPIDAAPPRSATLAKAKNPRGYRYDVGGYGPSQHSMLPPAPYPSDHQSATYGHRMIPYQTSCPLNAHPAIEAACPQFQSNNPFAAQAQQLSPWPSPAISIPAPGMPYWQGPYTDPYSRVWDDKWLPNDGESAVLHGAAQKEGEGAPDQVTRQSSSLDSTGTRMSD